MLHVELRQDVGLLSVELASSCQGAGVDGGDVSGALSDRSQRFPFSHAGAQQASARHCLPGFGFLQSQQRRSFLEKALNAILYQLLRRDIPLVQIRLLGVVGLIAALDRVETFRGVLLGGVAFRGVGLWGVPADSRCRCGRWRCGGVVRRTDRLVTDRLVVLGGGLRVPGR